MVFNRGWLERFVLVLLMLSLTGKGLADDVSAASKDPQGASHAARLKAAFEAAGLNGEDPAFQKLFDQDPNLSRRAFLPLLEAWEKETDPKRAEAAAELYSYVGGLSLAKFGDYIPNLIIDAINEDSPDADALCSRYSDFLIKEDSKLKLPAAQLKAYGPYDDTYTVIDVVADYPKELFAIHRLYRAKMLRFDVALLLENYRRAWLERETFEVALAPIKKLETLDGLVDPYDDIEGAGYRFNNVRINLDLGLLDYAFAKMEKANDSAIFYPKWAMAYLNGARIAYEQARLPALKEMIAGARQEMAKDPSLSSHQAVMKYVLITAEYRQRRLEGFNPTPQQTEAEFRAAWAALKAYEPMVSAAVDDCWVEGRHCTRFWMEELRHVPEAERICRETIGQDWQKWWNLTLEKQLRIPEREDLLLRPQYLTAFYILGPNFFDQLTYRWMVYPESTPKDPGEVKWALDSLARLPESVRWVADQETGEGFPPYDPGSVGLLQELVSRCKLIGARSSAETKESRRRLLSEAVNAASAVHQPSSRGELLILAGVECKALGDADSAITCWQEVVTESDDIPLAKAAFQSNFLLAREYLERKDYAKALYHAEKATQKLETVSPLIGFRSPEAQEWSRELTSITSLSARVHLAQDSPEKALAALTKGQQLLAAALEVEGRPGVKQDAEDVRRQQQEFSVVTEKVARLEAQPASPERDGLLAESKKLLAESKAQYLLKSRELRQEHPGLYSRALKFDPLDLPSLQSQLPADAAVLQYFPTEDTLYTFLVSKESFRLRSVAVPRKELDKQIVTFLRGLRRNAPGDAQVAAQSRQLYDTLIAPSLEDLQGKSSVVLIPTGRLHGLPFACLSDPQGQPLVEKWRLLELAKSTDLQRLAKEADSPIESMVAFANATGDLPAAQSEGEKVASIFPNSKLFETKDATKSNFFSYGGGAQVLHIATHGEWNLDDSLKNYLAMAGSEKIAQEEIFQLALDDTSLVILSACNTAMGEGAEGGYVASLAEAFWLAGSHSVVASLWSVDDSSTAMLMETFYQRLKAGDDKAEALRAAQLKVRSEKKFEHPYYWAGFVLFGERR